MILEAIQYAATYPATPNEFRPFIGGSVSLWSRATRCAREWAGHEENCQQFVIDTIDRMRQRRTVVVLGSGLLRDVPVEALARTFDTVVLVDLVHLASVRLWLTMKRLDRVRLISRDLSGLDPMLSGECLDPLGFLRQVPYLDLVISANLLSQIAVGAERRLEQDKRADATDIVPQLIEAHLRGLEALPCSTILLSDVTFKVQDGSGGTKESADLLHGVAPPDAERQWPWPVVPFGEESRRYRIVHDVVAVRSLR